MNAGSGRRSLPRRSAWRRHRPRRLRLAGSVALVTGAAAGIGRATATELVARGTAVVVVDRDEVAAKAAAAELGPSALAIGADVTDAEAMRAAVDETLRRFGRLDLVVANAGITPPPATLRTAQVSDFARVVDVNLLGVLRTVQPAIEPLIGSGGHIVVIASCAAFSPPLGGSAYMVSKAGVEVLARALRLELACHQVSCSTVAFGMVDTDLARGTLDDHEVGRQLDAMLPSALRQRLEPQVAARLVVDAARRRRPRVTAPAPWLPLGWLRGVFGPVVDAWLTRSARVDELVGLLERDAELPVG